MRALQVSSLFGKLRSAVQSVDERLACILVGSLVTCSIALGSFLNMTGLSAWHGRSLLCVRITLG